MTASMSRSLPPSAMSRSVNSKLGFHDDGQLRRDQRVPPDLVAREAGVLGGDEVGTGAQRALGREREHLRAQRRGDALVARHRLRGGVEPVEEVAHPCQRARVLGGGLGVADADSQQEASWEVTRQLRMFAGDVGRLVLPDVEDPRGDGQGARALQERAHLRQRGAAADPERAVAQRLDLGDRIAPVMAAAPDSDPSRVHRHWSLWLRTPAAPCHDAGGD
jgi:hypothetical protein